MARSAAAPLLAALLALMLVAGSDAQFDPNRILAFFGITLPPGITISIPPTVPGGPVFTDFARTCALRCNIPLIVLSPTTLRTIVSVEGCSF
jgi:hypothetical protein